MEKYEGELVTYLPPPNDADTVKWRGIEFKANTPVRIMNEDHIEAARANRFFHVGGDSPKTVASGPPENAMAYRGHVMGWIAGVTTVDQLATNWAADTNMRVKCEVGYDDISFLGTLIEPKLRLMAQSEGLNVTQVAEIWIRHGVLSLPWRAD